MSLQSLFLRKITFCHSEYAESKEREKNMKTPYLLRRFMRLFHNIEFPFLTGGRSAVTILKGIEAAGL